MSKAENGSNKIEWYEELPEAFKQNRKVPFNHDLGGGGVALAASIPRHVDGGYEDGISEEAEQMLNGLKNALSVLKEGGSFEPKSYSEVEGSFDSADEFLTSVVDNYDVEGVETDLNPESVEDFVEKYVHLGKASQGFSEIRDFYNDQEDKDTYGSLRADILMPPSFECDEFGIQADESTEDLLENIYLPGNETWGFSHTLKKNHYDHVVSNDDLEGSKDLRVEAETYDQIDYLEDEKPEWADGWMEILYISEGAEVSEQDLNYEEISSAPENINNGGLGVYLWSDIVEEFGGHHYIEAGEDGEYIDTSVIPYSESHVDTTYRREDRVSQEKLMQERKHESSNVPLIADD